MLINIPVLKSSTKLLATLDKAMEAAKEGKQLLLQRQKYIKMADRSEHGWKVVQEYETDYLAADSGDEKRIAKAEKAAEVKVVASKKKKAHAAKFSQIRANHPWPSSYRPGGWQSQSFGHQSSKMHSPSMMSASSSPAVRPIGPCHACHEFGHLRPGSQYDVKPRVRQNRNTFYSDA